MLELPIVPPSKDLVPVAAIFALDENGIIHFTAVQMSLRSRLQAITEFASRNDGMLDEAALKQIDYLVECGEAKIKTVQVQMA